jgi:hypothetical protein
MTNLEPKQTPHLTTEQQLDPQYTYTNFSPSSKRTQQIRPLGIWKKIKGGRWQGKVGGRRVHGAIEVWGGGGCGQEPGQRLDRPPDRFSGISRT